MQVYAWAFISVLFYMSSGRIVYAVASFFITALAMQYPMYGIPILMLSIMYLLLLILKLYQTLESAESSLQEYKEHVEFLESRHSQFVNTTLSFTSHVKQVFTPMIQKQSSPTPIEDKRLDEDSEVS